MGWDDYYKRSAKRYSFDELGCPDFWVEMRSLLSFPYGETKKLMAAATLENPEDAIRVTEELLSRCIVDWNLTDPKTGIVLPLPEHDRASFSKIPSEFFFKMQQWLIEEATVAVPAPSGIGSGAP